MNRRQFLKASASVAALPILAQFGISRQEEPKAQVITGLRIGTSNGHSLHWDGSTLYATGDMGFVYIAGEFAEYRNVDRSFLADSL